MKLKMKSNAVHPLLKWAGGKRQLLPELRRYYPPEFARYIEPFVGSGAVFFDLHGAGRLRNREAILIDSNADLIACYEAVRDRPEEVARALEHLAAGHARDGTAHYYRVRDDQFNPQRARLRQPGGRVAYSPELAATLIYLNRTCFNGLFRLNASGGFNVPAGRYERPRIADRDKILRVAAVLGAPGVRIVLGSFALALEMAAPGDFLYFDPPYAPVSATARFTAYTAGGFGPTDQQHLQRVVVALVRRGCHVLLSNSTAEEIRALYATNVDARDAGLRAFRVAAQRAINSKAAGRGRVNEYLITNGAAAG
jgi:DNA adenine methylase